MIVDFQEDLDNRGVLQMRSVDIKGSESWYSYLSFREGEKSIHDHRMAERSYECRPMTDDDRSLYAFRPPGFGEFDDLWRRISTYLSNEGFGVLA